LVKSIYDGVFYIDMPTFKESFMFTSIAQDLSSYHHNYYMRLNDQTTAADSPGSGYYCGKTCVAHTIYIDSPVTQKLYISTHLHDVRSYPLDCNPTSTWAGLRYNFGTYTYQTGWFEGPYNFQVQTINAGQQFFVTVEIPVNDDLTKDWSIVVLSETGEVTMTHSNGDESDHWPNQSMEEESEPVIADDAIVPGEKILLDYQTEFDQWIRDQSITATYDNTVSQCVV